MRGIRHAALVLMLTVLAACSSGPPVPARESPPPTDQPAQINVAYGVTLGCEFSSFQLGNLFWSFNSRHGPWPPRMPSGPIMQPYDVPGVMVLTSPTTATFHADSDGSVWSLTGDAEPRGPVGGCL